MRAFSGYGNCLVCTFHAGDGGLQLSIDELRAAAARLRGGQGLDWQALRSSERS